MKKPAGVNRRLCNTHCQGRFTVIDGIPRGVLNPSKDKFRPPTYDTENPHKQRISRRRLSYYKSRLADLGGDRGV
jgi:hypothetical protein